MITIVAYGLGNVRAFENTYRRLGVSCEVTADPDKIRSARSLILPGVGAFDHAMATLEASGLVQPLHEAVVERGAEVLGICVGMQIMAKRSQEGSRPGLGWIEADVLRLDISRLKHATGLPHMGWNDVAPIENEPLLANLAVPRFYFLHSYHVVPAAPAATIATAFYGNDFCAAFRVENVYGTQFHPEKSHDAGTRVLQNFAQLGGHA